MSKSYGVLKLTVTSPEQTYTEVITLQEAKTFLRLPDFSPADTEAETLIEQFIMAAREQAEVAQGKPLVAAQYDLTLDGLFSEQIYLGEHVSSVDLFKYRDSSGAWTTLTNGTHFILDSDRGLVMPPYGDSWPSFTAWPSSAVLIRFTVDPPTIPAIIKNGMYLLIAAWHEGRLAFDNRVGDPREYPYAITSCLSYGAKNRLS